jgi:hypothetical protein
MSMDPYEEMDELGKEAVRSAFKSLFSELTIEVRYASIGKYKSDHGNWLVFSMHDEELNRVYLGRNGEDYGDFLLIATTETKPRELWSKRR